MSRVPVGVLASGSGTNLAAILEACAASDYPARVAVVVSDRADAQALDRARRLGIPAVHVPKRNPPDRRAYDAACVAVLQEHGVEWVCLAGYMRLVTPVFLDAFPWRILNVHPALLPAFPGLDPQGQALAAGVRVSGCTIHLVDDGTDTGPIVAQGAVPVLPTDDIERLRTRILRMEHQLYPRVLRWAAEGRLTVDGRRVVTNLAGSDATFVFDPRP